ncbi:TetR/AcrR family transcriptional regulator [Propionibacterium acidifaciens]|uniref:TetR/AcrR family transcriptional regulator n=1 Tax=Propionibacterium acidifaciens TaxID=556499 RepID=UPI00360A21AA
MEIPVEPQEVLARFEAIGTADELPEVIVRAFVDIWESPRSGPQMRALLRRALEDPERFGALVDFLSTAAVEPVSARLEGLSPSRPGCA